MKNDLPPVFVPSASVLKKMTAAADKPRWDPIKLGRENTLVLLRNAFPDVMFSARIARSQRYGDSVNIKWPMLPGAPSIDDVKHLVTCFKSKVDFAPHPEVLPNEEGLTKLDFQRTFGALRHISLVPWTPTPEERQAMLQEALPSAPAAKAPRPRF